MKTIWKFTIKITDEQQIEMPKDAEILTARELAGNFHIWAVVDPESTEFEKRTFHIYGTGNPIPEIDLLHQTRKYIATIIQASFYVWHVFEIK